MEKIIGVHILFFFFFYLKEGKEMPENLAAFTF